MTFFDLGFARPFVETSCAIVEKLWINFVSIRSLHRKSSAKLLNLCGLRGREKRRRRVPCDAEQRQARNNNCSKFTALSVAAQRSGKNTDDEWASKTERYSVYVPSAVGVWAQKHEGRVAN